MGGPGFIDTTHPRYKEFLERVSTVDAIYGLLSDKGLEKYHEILYEMDFPPEMTMALIIEDPSNMRFVERLLAVWRCEKGYEQIKPYSSNSEPKKSQVC